MRSTLLSLGLIVHSIDDFLIMVLKTKNEMYLILSCKVELPSFSVNVDSFVCDIKHVNVA